MDYLMVYLWTKLDMIQTLCWITIGITLCTMFIGFLILYEDNNSYTHDNITKTSRVYDVAKRDYPGFCRLVVIILSILLPIAILLPSRKDVLYIYLLPKLLTTTTVTESVEFIEKIPTAIKEYIHSTDKD